MSQKQLLRKAQLRMLDMLKVVDNICRRNGIRYWLCSGTLLGAVRHKGFIPWDDDLDISMMRSDYLRFLEVAEKELPQDFYLQTRQNDSEDSILTLECKMRDKKSLIRTVGMNPQEKGHGLYIDIFVLDKYPKKKIPYYYQRCLKYYLYLLGYGFSSVGYKHESVIRRFLAQFQPLFRKLIKSYQKRVQGLIKKNNALTEDYCIGFGLDIIFKRVFEEDVVFPLKEMEFEDGIFYVPNKCDIYLTTCFGSDYMTPPPVEMRSKWMHITGLEIMD